jgi:hypothetical protein
MNVREEVSFDTIRLDYPVRSRPRYGWGRSNHTGLTRILAAGHDRYRSVLADFTLHIDKLARIRVEGGPDDGQPRWINHYLPGLDAVALYGMLARLRPRRYMEVGSGNSTRVARRAIRDLNLPTRVISIDPHPRAEIDRLCDEVIRRPFEEVPVDIVDQLEPGDIFFLDGSHRVFMNSDVVVAFLEVLPRLRPGIHVHVHDIWLPSDYPPEWTDRFYSEQYMLAAQLLAGASSYEVEFPCWYVANDPELAFMLLPLWEPEHMWRVERHGCSFRLEIKQPAPGSARI